jgi:hypothetical protein
MAATMMELLATATKVRWMSVANWAKLKKSPDFCAATLLSAGL